MPSEERVAAVAADLRVSSAAWPAVREALEYAELLVARRIGSADVPARIRELAEGQVAAELYLRRGSRIGLAQIGDAEPQVIRVSADPMKCAEPILAPYLGPAVA